MRLCSLLCFSEIVWHTKKHRQLHSIKNKRDPKYLKGLCHAIILLPLAIFFSTHQLNFKNNDPGSLFYTILGTETISYHFLPQMAKMDLHNLKLQKSPINPLQNSTRLFFCMVKGTN